MPPRKPPTRRSLSSRSSSIGKRGSRSSLDIARRASKTSTDSSRSARKHSLHGQPTAIDGAKAAGTAAAAPPPDLCQPDDPGPQGVPTNAAPATTDTTGAAPRVAQRRASARRLSLVVEPTHRYAFDDKRPTREESKTSYLNVNTSRTTVSKARDEFRYDVHEPVTATKLLNRLVSLWPQDCLKICLVAGMLIAIIGMLVMLALLRRHQSGPEMSTTSWPFPVCNTADCAAHATTLSASMTSAWDPCDDFSRYVCSSWKRKHAAAAESLTEQLLTDSLLALARTNGTSSSDGDNVLEDRPIQFMGLCMTARPDQDATGLLTLKEFLKDEVNFLDGLKERPATHNRLLEALAVLSGKWLVPLWFRLDLVMTGDASSVVTIEPEPLATFWRKLHAKLNTTYGAYVEQFIKVVYDEGASASYLKFLKEDSAAVQTNVLHVLSLAASSHLPVPLDGRLSDLPEFAPKFTGYAWAAALSKVLGWSISDQYVVYVSSRQILDAMNELANSTSAEHLLYHTMWWFVQQVAALTSNALFEATRVALGEAGNLYQRLLCGVQVSITYGTLLATRHAASVQASLRQSVDDTLSRVHTAAATTVPASNSLGPLVRDSVYFMLLETHPVVWPLPPNFEPTQLRDLYGDSVDGSRGFFGHWHSSRRGIQRSFGRPVHTTAAGLYKLNPTSLASFSPAFKGVSVSTAAIQVPLFYADGTAAMRFGGLGFMYAAQLVRNMDVRALLDAAAVAESPVALEADHVFQSFQCPDAEEKRAAFPHLPALVLAHAAYIKNLNGTADRRLPGLEAFTPTQVFFMTACLSLCEEDAAGRPWSGECNAAARNYAPFVEAFSCPPGSPMNRKEKCGLLKQRQ